MNAAIDGGAGLLQLRVPGLPPAGLARDWGRRGARLVVNGVDPALAALVEEGCIDGLHAPARHLDALAQFPKAAGWFGASCHDPAELEVAAAAGAQYAFLSPLRQTPSHPERPGLGWDRFSEWVAPLRLPVYALGGMVPADLEAAWAAGAQGIAGIRGFGPLPP